MIVIHKATVAMGNSLLSSVPPTLLPHDAKPLAARMQNRTLCVWYETDNRLDAVGLVRRVRVVGTGESAPARFESDYVETVLDGPYVWHVYLDAPEVDGAA